MIPFAPRVVDSIEASLRLASTVVGRAAGAAAGVGGSGAVADPSWLSTLQHVLSAVYDASLPAASSAASTGARYALPVASALLASVARGGMAVMAATGFSGGPTTGESAAARGSTLSLSSERGVSGATSTAAEVDWQYVVDD